MNNASEAISQNIGLIKQVVQNFKPKSKNEFDEFVQLGRIAVWKAYNKYDSSKAKFSTMAWKYISWEIIRHLNKGKNGINIVECEVLPEAYFYDNKIYEYIPDNLSKQELMVVKMRLEGYSFIEIGKKMKHTNGWANQIFKSAISKIEKCNEKKIIVV